MKIKKTMSERALAANQANSEKSTGPSDTTKTRFNAIKGGFLTQQIFFRNDGDKQKFDSQVEQLSRDHRPVGVTEQDLVAEMAFCTWRLQNLNGWESVEISNRKNTAAAILKAVGESGDAQEIPLLGAIRRGWEPDALVVRTGTRSCEEEESLSDEPIVKTGNTVIEAKMGNSLDLILRYGAAIRRDYYRALAALLQLQRERFELEALEPANLEAADEEK